MNSENINNYSYDELQRMREHAKNYKYESDKKSFLKQVSPIEQKMILLSSSRPYEVLAYLDGLDLRKTKTMLEQLRDDEIIDLLALFTSEDKKRFYATFSQPFLVNRFIDLDAKAYSHVSDLELDRKVELLDNSNMSTIDATKKVYESISSEDKDEVSNSLTTAQGSYTFDSMTASDIDMSTNYEDNTKNIEESQTNLELPAEEKNDNNELEKQSEDVVKEQEEKNELPKEKEEVQKEEPQLSQSLVNDNKILSSEKDVNKDNENVIKLFDQAKIDAEVSYINEIKKIIETKTKEDPNIKKI